MQRPDGLAFLRVVIANNGKRADAAEAGDPQEPYLAARGAQIQVMLDRAKERGENILQFTDVLDGILAPIYLRVVFRVGRIDDTYLTALVKRLLPATDCEREARTSSAHLNAISKSSGTS